MQNYLLFGLVIAASLFVLRRAVPGFFCSRGYAHQDRGHYEAAERWFLRAAGWEEHIRQLTGQQRGVAIVYTALGLLYHCQNRTTEAAERLNSAISIYRNLGRVDDLAPVYASLGKLYYDTGDMTAAEQALNEALAIYSRRSVSGEAMEATARLLDRVAERRQDCDKPSTYTDTENSLSLIIPADWLKQRSVQDFSDAGGQIAISHKTHRATFTVSVGPPDKPEWIAQEARATAVREYLAHVPGRVSDAAVTTFRSVGGEQNTVWAEYQTESTICGATRRQQAGLISIVHHGLEYALQWSAEPDLEQQAKAIVDSFTFET
jgi:tetratricopeptide (TPR) repeat protein